MNKTYLFYDLETTGRSKCFDQILQFAAIRTDLNLNELERYEYRIKLNCDVIPEPAAILIHRISIAQMLAGSPEASVIAQIHKLVNTPGTQSGGYNTLRFDDEFLRFAFYRNLLPPYTHQWSNDCGRFDLLPITQLYFLYNTNEAVNLIWPRLNDKLSLKLENLNQANQLASGSAHNALVDVEATLALAKHFRAHTKMWEYAMGSFAKATNQSRRQQLPVGFISDETHYLALMIGETGADNQYQFPVLYLGQHQHYKNQQLWLRLDQSILSSTHPDTIAENTWVCRKKTGEGGIILPYLPRFTQHLTDERQAITQSNLQWLQENAAIFKAIQAYYQNYTYPKIPGADIETTLYENGFLSREEESLCHLFRQAPIAQKLSMVGQFTHPVLRTIVLRYLGRNYFSDLTPELQQEFNQYLSSLNPDEPALTPLDFRGNQRLTRQQALEIIHKIRTEKTLDSVEHALLDELAGYLSKAPPPLAEEWVKAGESPASPLSRLRERGPKAGEGV